ncbi:hypothetical protein TW79_17060 [Tritonibacter mobilis]|uniref:Uncharacterized protein n=1 Tax=Tritonibacter mobilis F1926 TaxID=1265309 RepID=A0A1B1A787_9RHOB|nr:hypothetical protein K529_016670 [Tritonibacter mobilis F1926]KJZ22675.1 hypothetical protein TW79_17060 [Tritonibacter mobilis]
MVKFNNHGAREYICYTSGTQVPRQHAFSEGYHELRSSVLLAQGDINSFRAANTAQQASILKKITAPTFLLQSNPMAESNFRPVRWTSRDSSTA